MTVEQRNALIAQYKAGYAEVIAALEGFPAGQLTAHPIAGKWSAAQIAHHLGDSEMQSAIRIRKLLAEPRPIVQAYDQEAWAAALAYEDRPIEPALAAFKAARETTAQLLDRMTDDDWRRHGWHSEAGVFHAEMWLQWYSKHAHDHATQIRRLREALAK